jgi:exonuclease III
MNILNWNIRGLGFLHKRSVLHNIVQFHKVDLVAIQETKHQEFSQKMLNVISRHFDTWIQLPAIVLSGCVLVGCNSSKFIIE